MSDSPNGHTPAILVRLSALEALGETHSRKLDEISEKLTRQIAIACPSPGSCIDLSRRLGLAEVTIRQLSDLRQQAIGMGGLIKIMWVAFGGGMVAGIVWLIRHLGHDQ